MNPSIAVVLNRYPAFSETFIAQEIRGLERLVFDIQLVTLSRALRTLIGNPDLRRRMGRAGAEKVRRSSALRKALPPWRRAFARGRGP